MDTTAPAPDRLLTSLQVSQLIGVPDNTLRSWRCDRVGPPYVRVGRSGRGYAVRYRARDIERWLDERTVQPGDPE